PCGGGMRVVERRMQRVGRQRGGVILVELDERADELVGARVARGVRVGLELALSRVEAGERMQEEEELGQHQEEEREGGRVARRRDAQAEVEPGRLDEEAEREEDGEAERDGE